MARGIWAAICLASLAVLLGGCQMLAGQPDCEPKPIAAVGTTGGEAAGPPQDGGCMPVVVVGGMTYTLFADLFLSAEATSQLTRGGTIEMRNLDSVGTEFWTHPAVPQRDLILMPTNGGPRYWQLYTPNAGVLPVAACALLTELPPDCSRG